MPNVNVLEADLAVLVVIDVQDKMLAAISSPPAESVLRRICTLIGAARILDIPILHTEQYPRGLGRTVAAVTDALAGAREAIEKATCSCWRDESFRQALQGTEREHVILAGVETHVCIQQTALDLMRVDFVPFVAVDAVGSRNEVDRATALGRMQRAGVELTTVESIIFELVERCDHPRFKDILQLIK